MENNNRSRRAIQPAKQAEEMITLRDILDIFVLNWKWFLASAIVCVALARVYLATKPFIYQRQAVMLVKDEGTGGRKSSTDALMQLNGVMMGSSVKNEVYILRSHQLIQEVVKTLGLDVLYTYKHRLQTRSLYNQKPFDIQFQDEKTIPATFRIRVLNAQEYEVSDLTTSQGPHDFTRKARFGEMVKTPAGTFVAVPRQAQLEAFQGKTISITHLDLERATNRIAAQVSAGEMDKESTLVRLVCTDTDIERADDILAAILEAYKRSIIEDKNLIAQSTANFIDDRIKLISSELSQVEGQLASFKQAHKLIDFSQNATAYLQQSSSARQRTIQAQAQQGAVRYMLDHLKSHSEGNSLVPTLGGLTDAAIQGQISKYNELMLQRNRLATNSGESSPIVREMDANLTQMRQTLLASMQGYAASVDLQVKQAEREEAALQGSMISMPQQEKQALDISRQQSIKETLYTYLLNKREETALQLAITEANIRVVEKPFGSRAPIAPRRLVISLTAMLIGLLLPYLYFQVRAMLNMGVRGRRDVEAYTTIPILGEIPHRKEGISDREIVVAEQCNDAISEAFRMVRFSLNFVGKDARVIMFTSTTPSEGKTFVSRNFAVTLGMTGKRVLLIDSDIRKRTQSKLSLDSARVDGLTSYLSGAVDDPFSLIVRERPDYQVDFLPAGLTPPNPAELLMSNRLELLIEKLKEKYDYIIVDNVPAQAVADAGIVNRIAELTIYVIREGKIDRRFLPELERLHQEGKFNNLCVLINDARMDKNKHGYGYGYGYGYGNIEK